MSGGGALPFRLLPYEVATNLEGAAYRYARTMPGIPHYYTLQESWDDPAQFTATVREMRRHEVVRLFYRREQHYLDVNGFTYWTMGASEEETILINRQYSSHGAYSSPFDAIAHSYDHSYDFWKKVEGERKALYELAQPSGAVLDVGCGTGLLADYQYRDIDRSRYVGIDPSSAMLGRFALKHPDYRAEATLLRSTFEDYETELRFDTIVAMAGSASHVDGVDVAAKARHLLASGGRAFLMFYRDPAAALKRLGLDEIPPLASIPSGAVRAGDYHVLEFTRDSTPAESMGRPLGTDLLFASLRTLTVKASQMILALRITSYTRLEKTDGRKQAGSRASLLARQPRRPSGTIPGQVPAGPWRGGGRCVR